MKTSFEERLNQVLPRLASPDVLDNLGAGGEIGFWIFDYPTPSELAMLCDLETFQPSEGDPDHYTFDDNVDLTVAGFNFSSPDEFESDF